MTRHQDADDRRRQVADALMHTVAESGLDRTTIRRVADNAGVSVGLVQRYFMTKDDLLRFGIEYVYQRTEERLKAVVIQPPVRNIVQGLAEVLLPVDDERERECRVWLAFVQASLTDPTQQETHLRGATGLIDGFRQALEGAQRAGELSPSLDAASEARALYVFVDGLTINGVATKAQFDRAGLKAALQSYIDRLFKDGAP